MPLKVGRPRKGNERRERVSFTLPPASVEWVAKEAARRGQSRSDFLASLLHLAQVEHSGIESNALRKNLILPRGAIDAFCRKRSVRRLALFGSVLRDDFRPDSDIDMVVEFEKGKEPGMFALTEMTAELSSLLGGRKVDLRTFAELSRHFRESVAREAYEVYGG